jgi:hypothetical protein
MDESGYFKKAKDLGLIKAKNNIVSTIQAKMLLNAYCKKSLSEEQIAYLQKFFKGCNRALAEIEAREAMFAVNNIVSLGEQVLKVI